MSVSIQSLHVMRLPGMGGLKSTQEREERQQKCASQVDFFEKQKENLKNMKCTSLEDIERKLEMFHSYEDQIAEAKKQYNNSQMSHVLDEAREIGEKIAEAADKTAPKTPEEREKERVEEALGTEEENKGMLSEIMDEVTEAADELQEELEEQLEEAAEQEIEAGLQDESQTEILQENTVQSADETAVGSQKVQNAETLTDLTLAEAVEQRIEQDMLEKELVQKQQKIVQRQYPHIDFRL